MKCLGFLLLCAACSLVSSAAWAQAAGPSIEPPVVLTHVDAVYPPAALAERKHADVVLAVTVDVDGHVSKVDVLTSGGELLDQAAIVATREWTFVPAKRDGKPVASRIRIPFHFAPPAPPPELVEEPSTPEPELGEQPAVPAAPPAPAPAPAAPVEIEVIGQSAPPTHAPSDFRVEVSELKAVPRQNASDLLKLAPGIFLTNESGEGHAEQMFLRGFDAGEGEDIELSVGGVPINESGNMHGNGYADTHFIIPEFVSGLRFIEGPFDPRQGNYAVAGSADYELGLEHRGLLAKLTGGSFGTERLLLAWGPPGESAHTFGGAEIYRTDGFGQDRDAQRASAMAQYEGRLGARGSYRLTTQAFSTHFHSAGLLRDDDYRAGRIGLYDSYDRTSYAREQIRQGGDSSRYSLALALESRADELTLDQQFFVIVRYLRLLENFTGFVEDTDPSQTVQRGDMLNLNVHEQTLGARGSARLAGSLAGRKQELELGYFARGDQVSGDQQRLAAATGLPYRTDLTRDATLGDFGLYADASVRPLGWLTLRGGARSEFLSYSVLEAQRNATSALALLPRVATILGPERGFSFLLSYGQGLRSVDPSYVTQDSKDVFAKVNAYEAGVSYQLSADRLLFNARSIFFQTHVNRDLAFDSAEGRSVLTGATTRTGWVGATRAMGSFFDESASLTLVRASYDESHLPVPYVPTLVARSDSALFRELPFSLFDQRVRASAGVGVSYVGPRALVFGGHSDPVLTADASAALSSRRFELALSVTNLFDRKYRLGEYDYVSDFHSQAAPTPAPTRMFAAGPPRSVLLSLAVYVGNG